MQFNYFLGFDISRNTLDYTLVSNHAEVIEQGQIPNTTQNVAKLLQTIAQSITGSSDSLLICCEEGGLYGNFLKMAATQGDFFLWATDALELKLSSGRRKGKSDQKDALMIAQYAFRYADQAKRFAFAPLTMRQIKRLSRQRQTLLQDISAWKTRLGEQHKFGVTSLPEVDKIMSKFLKEAQKALDAMDQRLLELIKADQEAHRKYVIALSVPGYGKKNILAVIAETEVFTKVTNAKACASYAGLCPYEYESGTSIKRRKRTSKACNKRLKTALHQGANNLTKSDNLFGDIYRRMRAKGRTRLQAINAVRNKMVRVLYACLENDTMYQKKYHERLRVQ